MSVVKINAIAVPEDGGPELEARFAARLGAVENMPGFEGFELLRPTAGEDRYFVYTRWATEDAFQNWRFKHMYTVQRIIGNRMGTGGSSGVSFLKKAIDVSFFPELFALRTEL